MSISVSISGHTNDQAAHDEARGLLEVFAAAVVEALDEVEGFDLSGAGVSGGGPNGETFTLGIDDLRNYAKPQAEGEAAGQPPTPADPDDGGTPPVPDALAYDASSEQPAGDPTH